MKRKRLTFQGSQTHNLSAQIDFPENGEIKAYALFAHCFTCSKELKAVNNISKAMTGKGFAVMRFDFTGLGESEGDFEDTNFSSNVEDLIAAAKYLESEYQAPLVLIGHSLGGAAVLQAAHALESVKAVGVIAAPHDPEHVTKLFVSKRDEIEKNGEAKVNLAGSIFTIKKQFIDDLEEANMEEHISNLRKALIIFHSPLDKIVGIDNAAKIFKTAKHPKSFVSLDEADHLLLDESDSKFVGSIIAEWSMRYLS